MDATALASRTTLPLRDNRDFETPTRFVGALEPALQGGRRKSRVGQRRLSVPNVTRRTRCTPAVRQSHCVPSRPLRCRGTSRSAFDLSKSASSKGTRGHRHRSVDLHRDARPTLGLYRANRGPARSSRLSPHSIVDHFGGVLGGHTGTSTRKVAVIAPEQLHQHACRRTLRGNGDGTAGPTLRGRAGAWPAGQGGRRVSRVHREVALVVPTITSRRPARRIPSTALD